ncbi:hypothetical protein CDAR_501231 [Caerostris darwini]|uniref:Uncharacterized protein n=1 Tax=Caerostris darwini TaxID=1538125 RepID=A0AAV4NNS3_9ARAC|nr:hypothetical protein CDAR_501231 [Caerostris darwini]
MRYKLEQQRNVVCSYFKALSLSLLPEKTPLKIPSPSMPKGETSTTADTRDTSPAEKGMLCLPTERYLSSISRK